jgi:hypothetical protein
MAMHADWVIVAGHWNICPDVLQAECVALTTPLQVAQVVPFQY